MRFKIRYVLNSAIALNVCLPSHSPTPSCSHIPFRSITTSLITGTAVNLLNKTVTYPLSHQQPNVSPHLASVYFISSESKMEPLFKSPATCPFSNSWRAVSPVLIPPPFISTYSTQQIPVVTPSNCRPYLPETCCAANVSTISTVRESRYGQFVTAQSPITE